MPLNIIRNDITRVRADAIVNTANPDVAIGSGVDEAIYEAAGADLLLAERAKIGPLKAGQAAYTPAFGLKAKYIIHTVGPVWLGGNCHEREMVASCYRESLRIADELGCRSIAFPLISTGNHGFPKDEALKIAVSEISSFLFEHDMTVYMVVYSKEAFVISGKAFSNIRTYIEEKDVKPPAPGRTGTYVSKGTAFHSEKRRNLISRREREIQAMMSYDMEQEMTAMEPQAPSPMDSAPAFGKVSGLDDILEKRQETFQEMLFRLIDRRGMTDPEVYKKANLDRKLFSKIRGNAQYMPSKRTALALAVALELNMDETIDLLKRAGLALSPSSRFDLIVGYCISHGIYNIFDINTYLFEYDQPLLVG